MTILDTLKKTAGIKSDRRKKKNEAADVDILDKLKQEHEEVAKLLQRLVDAGRGVERKALLKRIKSVLVPHLRAEEKTVYDAILRENDSKTKQDGEEGYLEHGLGDKMLVTLGKIGNAMSPEFSATSKVLKELVEHHVEEEERNVWEDVRKYFSADDRIAMNRHFEAAKKKVKIPT